MKKIFKLLLLSLLLATIIASSILFVVYYLDKNGYLQSVSLPNIPLLSKPCDKPLHYSIGNVDERFSLTQAEVFRAVQGAEKIWEDASGINLLEYDQESEFTINFIYDQRQIDTIESKKIQGTITQQTQSYESLSKELDKLERTYTTKTALYNKNINDYNTAANEYDDDVNKWNKKGGAPEKEYEKLMDEKDILENTRDYLNNEQQVLNALYEEIQVLVTKVNSSANTINSQIETYNTRYGNQREFDQGIYFGTHIDIYQFEEASDLTLVLAHEFGHALGIDDHVENPESIMYYLMDQQDLNGPTLSAQDMDALSISCEFDESLL